MIKPGRIIEDFAEGVKLYLHDMFTELGFKGGKDFIVTILAIKGVPFAVALQWFVAFFIAALAFIEKWVWNAPFAFLGLGLVILSDSYYGYQVARTIKGEAFSIKKYWRTFSVLSAHIVMLTALHLARKDYIYMEYFNQMVFWALFLAKFKSLAVHYVALKIQTGEVVNIVKDLILRFLATKLSGPIIDSIQGAQKPQPPEIGEPPVPLPEPIQTPLPNVPPVDFK